MDDLEAAIDGTTVTRTSDGKQFTADVVGLTRIRLTADDGDKVNMDAGMLDDRLKQGEYYLPDGGGYFQDALRELADGGGA